MLLNFEKCSLLALMVTGGQREVPGLGLSGVGSESAAPEEGTDRKLCPGWGVKGGREDGKPGSGLAFHKSVWPLEDIIINEIKQK